MDTQHREEIKTELWKLSEALKTVISSGAKLAGMAFEIALEIAEANQRIGPGKTAGKVTSNDSLMTMKEVAEMLNVTVHTVHTWTGKGILPSLKYNGEPRYNRDDVLQAGLKSKPRK